MSDFPFHPPRLCAVFAGSMCWRGLYGAQSSRSYRVRVGGLLAPGRPGEYCDPHPRLLLQTKARKERDRHTCRDTCGHRAGVRACERARDRMYSPEGAQRSSDAAHSGPREQAIGELQANVPCSPMCDAGPNAIRFPRDGATLPRIPWRMSYAEYGLCAD